MNDAEMINQSGYRRAFRYLKNTQSSLSARFSGAGYDKDVAAVEQMSTNALELVFFPSYARTIRKSQTELNINIHGWLYTPVPAGKQSRRNRYTMLLARNIAGLPAVPDVSPADARPLFTDSNNSDSSPLIQDFNDSPQTPVRRARSNGADSYSGTEETLNETFQDLKSIDRSTPESSGETKENSRQQPGSKTAEGDSSNDQRIRPPSIKRENSDDSQFSTKFHRHYSDHDLLSCHANLTTRITPFLSKPVIGRAVTVDILADSKIITSRKLLTGDNGHFRSTIDLIQGQIDVQNVKKLEARVREDGISASTEIHVVKDAGVSIISDMDDTVKHTNIVAGMREAFRNAFVRDLSTLEITGVRKWYESMKAMGCNIHYVSNAPYQLWPCLAAFIKIAGLPAGSIHLKQYSGFLQGMFEPAAEKKRANVEKILKDFPERKFLLIGDSGEQDLELYSELASSIYSKQILGIFIRDVSSSAISMPSTPTGTSGENYFSPGAHDDKVDSAPVSHALSPVVETGKSPPSLPARPKTGNLIDLDFEHATEKLAAKLFQGSHAEDLAKSFAAPFTGHSGVTSEDSIDKAASTSPKAAKARPELPRKPTSLKFWSGKEAEKTGGQISPTKNGVLEKSLMNVDTAIPASPTTPTSSRRPNLRRSMSANSSYYGEGRRLTKAQERTHAWELRLARARALLPKEIKLYTWKEGADCQEHAEALIRKAMPLQA